MNMMQQLDRLRQQQAASVPALWDFGDSNPDLWIDFSDVSTITHSNNNIASITDKGSSGSNLTKIGTGNIQTNVTTLNGLNVAQWPTAVNTLSLVSSPFAGRNWQHSFVVACWQNGTVFTNYCGIITALQSGGTASGVGLIGDSGTQNMYSGVRWWNTLSLNSTNTNSPFRVLPTINSPTMISASSPTAISVNGVCIGSDRQFGNRGWQGYIAEIISFSRLLLVDEQDKVWGRLAHKWGLTANLPAGHPYKTNPPTV